MIKILLWLILLAIAWPFALVFAAFWLLFTIIGWICMFFTWATEKAVNL